MNRRLALIAATVLSATTFAVALPKEDRLTALEQNPSPQATEQVAKIYHSSKDPYSRLWLMDILYARVQQYHDTGAMTLLWDASKDVHPDVRRKAISNLEAFHFLPESQGREIWFQRIRGVVQASSKDTSESVRSAGRDLEIAAQRWQEKEVSSAALPPRPESSRFPVHFMMPIFVWAVCLQLIGYGWYGLGASLLTQLGPSGRAVLKTTDTFKRNPWLLIFPLMTTLLLLVLLGTTLGWELIAAIIPASELDGSGAGISWGTLFITYLTSGMACLLPAAIMAGKLAGNLKESIRHIFGFLVLNVLALALVWPAEALGRFMRVKWHREGSCFWMAKTGTPFAVLLTAGVMIQGNLSPWKALQEAARRFPAAVQEPGAEFWGRAPFQAQFMLWCFAAPVLFSLALIPSLELGFHPNQLFDLWFLSNTQLAVGFGWWIGILLSVVGLGQLISLGAVRAAQLVRESFVADAKPDIKRRGKS